MSIPFIDLKAQYARIAEDVQAGIGAVLEHGKYIAGPEIEALERELAEFSGVWHAVACSSGTDALLMSLMSLEIGPGDAVFTTPFTFVATAEVIDLLGATPVFVDIEPDTWNMDPVDLRAKVEGLKSGKGPNPRRDLSSGLRPRALIPVDLFGLPADYAAIDAVAREHGLDVVEDAAQSFGAQYRGRRTCSLGLLGCTSFFPAKPLGCYGDGGMCFTSDDEHAKRLRSIRNHGQGRQYEYERLGVNGRLDTIQAAILRAKFTLFPEEIELRQAAAERYNALLARIPGLLLPSIPEGRTSVWAQYSFELPESVNRESVRKFLSEKGIPTAVYYPKPLHIQAAYAYLGYGDGDFPAAEAAAQRILSLPMHPYLEAEAQEHICELVGKAMS